MALTDIVIDTETYPNCFLLCAENTWGLTFTYEISDRKNDSKELFQFLTETQFNSRLIGFNFVGFDGPIIELFLNMGGRASAKILYDKAQAIINDANGLTHYVAHAERHHTWIDLYRIHHFNNKARATSLKVLEFNMRMDNIEDLPFPFGKILSSDEIDTLITYCQHDVKATKQFYDVSRDAITLREDLTKKYNRDMMNHDDVKIGSAIFEMALEKAGVSLYEYRNGERVPRQTKRDVIVLKDCIPSFIEFKNEEFARVLNYLKSQTITETKGVFKDLVARVGGLDFVFGTGGLHASLEHTSVYSDDEYVIRDVDCTSMYPSIAIAYNYYPEHLGETFVKVYQDLREERIRYKKGSSENSAYKLALNGTYGKSNDVFSVFYDPKFTMSVTLTGQLLLAKLAEYLLDIKGLQIIQCNTDGITCKVPKAQLEAFNQNCKMWESVSRLTLEHVDYSTMSIRDVNSYIAKTVDGKVKRKGAFEWKLGWHQDHSALIVPKAAEKVILERVPIRETVHNWPDIMDFMLRIRVPKNSYLTIEQGEQVTQVQNTTRYHVAKGGAKMFKWMPPLAGKTEWRKNAVQAGWGVQVCNDIRDAEKLPIDYDYYVNEVEKLCLNLL